MADENFNEIECVRCGGVLHIGMTRCPHCGVNIYEPEDDLLPESNALTRVQDALRLPLAVFLGWFMTAFIGMVLYLPIHSASTEAPSTTFVILLATLALSAGGFSGGFLYQRVSQQISKFGNVSQIIFSIFLGIAVFLTEGVNTSVGIPISILGLLVMGAASYFGIRTAEKMLKNAMIEDLFAPVVESQKRYQELLAKVGHDRAVAERLIEHERRFMPKATRDLLIENAIKRWERDNRVV